ncbi:MAG: type I methionyl aminopeptidase [Candidatus Nealsonbacteria bacterium CG23_combo_of_CG06-09_8_20_14_all_38_19]|uniref:Methionine aminopeptidase n=1 Tax=Candidatus Nealsonbacteria bacterium CG23_combo_of_CG06-09_8_20_14_all_38_19 TaxID=1974721 RepID=A0A2G9YWC4_9BACT|nr:MAG: type I methionyl aminopeptidase [Candidatus Nealsonbacteria bacterium CG23_combo_of_CG06-09_8_20_14_all_38_19]
MTSIKKQSEIKLMAEGGKILARIMRELKDRVMPGVATRELDRLAENLVLNSQAKCSFKGYDDYPACLCVSLNDVIVHGVPSDDIILKDGDIVSLDLGILFKGYHTDMAITVPVGKVSPEANRLIHVAKKSLKRAIKKVRPGNTFGDIGNTIQRYVESQGFNVIRSLCGHAIGRKLHEDPQILNYGKRHTGSEIKEEMTFCLEPMVVAGDWKIIKSEDGFGYKTKDGSLSAHFEHTILVTSNGCKVLTPLEES